LVDLTVLQTELSNNPQTYGGTSDKEAAALLNAVSATETIEVAEVSPTLVQNAVVNAEYIALTASNQRAWLAIVGLPSVPVKLAGLRSQIMSIWTAGTTTRASLAALQTRLASRAEVLFGENVRVTHPQVAQARAL
jgi:hypothetical protein